MFFRWGASFINPRGAKLKKTKQRFWPKLKKIFQNTLFCSAKLDKNISGKSHPRCLGDSREAFLGEAVLLREAFLGEAFFYYPAGC